MMMKRSQFEHRIQVMWPHAEVLKIVSIAESDHIAVLQIDGGTPFFVGLLVGHPTPVATSLVRALERRISARLEEVRGALDLVHALSPKPGYDKLHEIFGISTDD